MNQASKHSVFGSGAGDPAGQRRARREGTLARPGRRSPLLALCAVALATLLLGGCATVATHPAAAPAVATDPGFAQARELARNAAALDPAARQDNEARIDSLLAAMDNATLARETAALPAGDPLYNYAGRALLNRGLPLPRPFEGGDWQRLAANRPPADSDGYRPPLKLAVLLPLSGDLSRAAVPVRDGLLAGYYGETRRRPDIVFYDTTGTPAGAIASYRRAVTEGADYIVGPLGRDEVSALFREHLTVPVLALNRGTVTPPPGSSSFSLAPEDDGIAAAEYLLSHGARHVLVLADPSLQRAVAAFREHLLGRGGAITQTLMVAEAPVDMTAALQAATTASGGVDAVFLALKPAQVRALAPQLASAGLAAKPRVATSQLATADGAAKDHALDGIAFPSEAWNVQRIDSLPSPARAAELLPSARGPAARLFAFGHDAWLLSAYLDRLATRADGSVQGATGRLRLDGFGNVVRTPEWSTHSGTGIVALPSIR
ncbi:penicillin-binding protein activator [Cognatiluteimonas telluris]|jgi:outer membrane PBP1 activator LpoA protein|uniref:penicillin-binding protein activator n=1 Tax=Cognatiluteimonas telluris TaxID=1104775 RepID=UPI0024341220|nr:penicillin-binding protein activator [Lysobacter telluris]